MPNKDSVTFFFLFHSIHDVLKAESALKGHAIQFEIVPVPRSLSSDCGVCIALQEPADEVISLLLPLGFDNCFSFNGKEYSHVDAHTLAPIHHVHRT